jgi:hypothetical protein
VVATSLAHLTKVDPTLNPTFQQANNLLAYTYFSEELNHYCKGLHYVRLIITTQPFLLVTVWPSFSVFVT